MPFYPAKGSDNSFNNFEWKDIISISKANNSSNNELWLDDGSTHNIQIKSEVKTKCKFVITTSLSHDATAMINGGGNYKENDEFDIPKGESTVSVKITGSHSGVTKKGTLYIKAMFPEISAELMT